MWKSKENKVVCVCVCLCVCVRVWLQTGRGNVTSVVQLGATSLQYSADGVAIQSKKASINFYNHVIQRQYFE